MQIKSTYHPDESITVIIPDFDPTDSTCQKIQTMLEAKKFTLCRGEFSWQWRRCEFTATTEVETFGFWIDQVRKMCSKFGGGEPVAVHKATSTSQAEGYTEPNDIIQLLLKKVEQLEQEVSELKKFDSDAQSKLRRLQECSSNQQQPGH